MLPIFTRRNNIFYSFWRFHLSAQESRQQKLQYSIMNQILSPTRYLRETTPFLCCSIHIVSSCHKRGQAVKQMYIFFALQVGMKPRKTGLRWKTKYRFVFKKQMRLGFYQRNIKLSKRVVGISHCNEACKFFSYNKHDDWPRLPILMLQRKGFFLYLLSDISNSGLSSESFLYSENLLGLVSRLCKLYTIPQGSDLADKHFHDRPRGQVTRRLHSTANPQKEFISISIMQDFKWEK